VLVTEIEFLIRYDKHRKDIERVKEIINDKISEALYGIEQETRDSPSNLKIEFKEI
jgi:hypothetical protein